MRKYAKIKVPLFGGEIWLCKSDKEFAEAHKDSGLSLTAVPGCSGVTVFLGESFAPICIVGIFNGKFSTIAHEMSHACFRILSSMGVELDAGGGNETFCYLLDHLVSKSLRHFGRADKIGATK